MNIISRFKNAVVRLMPSSSYHERLIVRLCIFVIGCMVMFGASSLSTVYASPYVGVEDKQLHYDLQTLSEWGYLDAVVTTYPVPWKGVAQQLSGLDASAMPYMPRQALQRLNHYLALAKQTSSRTFVELQGNTESPRLTSLDGPTYNRGSISLKQQFMTDQWFVQGSLNIDDQGEINLDNSLIAYQFEDWQIRFGALDQFWGPAQSSSLILSNNARPVPAVAFSRGSTQQSDHSWLSWLGSWYYTGQFAQLESQREVPKAKLMLNRFTFAPLKQLEIGVSWAVMWGGETQPEGLSEFIDLVTFKKTCARPDGICDDSQVTKQGNHLAGFDVKYSFNAFDRPVTVYAQRIGEDAVNGYQITDNANLIGLSTYLGNAKVFVETSDTNIACASAESTITNCYYEHGTYKSGYRHHNRAIGSTFDSDAKQITLGTNYRFEDGAIAEVLLRKAQLNSDGTLPSPVLVDYPSEELLQLSGFYQRPFGSWLIKAGGSVENKEYEDESDTDFSLYFNTVYSF